MRQANFKNVKVGERFIAQDGRRFVKIRPCVINGQKRNAILIGIGVYWDFGNVAVAILGDDEE